MINTVSRSKEKRDFWGKFRHPDVVDVYKQRLFDLFGNRCFRCSATDRLQIDHHVPRTSGGRLEPGNLVVLCRRCNIAKGRLTPDVFYGRLHLIGLAPLLEAQHELFALEWDWTTFDSDKRAYLEKLGVPPDRLERIFNDPTYVGYISPDSERIVHTIDLTFAINAILDQTRSS